MSSRRKSYSNHGSNRARNPKKVIQTRKMKELNQKEERDATEIEYAAKFETGLVKQMSPVPPTLSETVSPSMPAVITSSPPVVEDPKELLEKAEEDRKVAEKNEENARVSQEVAAHKPVTVASSPAVVIEPPKPQLPKYDYKEDQWSPLNPEGKKQYDRAFLVMLQSQPLSMQKPKGLPNLELVVKDTALQLNLSEPSRGPISSTPSQQSLNRTSQYDMLMPAYARGNQARQSGGGGGGHQRGRQSQQGREKPKKIITISTSLNEDVKLHASSNAWKAGFKSSTANEEESEEMAKTEDLYKKVRGILNKLTPQKFDTLVEQVGFLPIDTESRLTGVIDLVFEKALDEPNFSVPYANMCKQLMLKQVPTSENKDKNVNFRKLLLTKCQKEFEKEKNAKGEDRLQEIDAAESEEKKKILKEEMEEEERKIRRRSLGNIRFIGELFKLGMLTPKIMHDCLRKLLMERHEDSLECLCRLLTTIGKELDEKKVSEGKGKNLTTLMDSYILNMRDVVAIKTTSSRLRFMLQDVIDLRLRGWVPRRDENLPKTIDEIHKQASLEAERSSYEAQQAFTPGPKRMEDRDRGNRGGGGGGPRNRSMQGGYNDGEGWNMVGSGKSRNTTSFNMIDSNKPPPKITKLQNLEQENIQLGPSRQAHANWTRGSSGGVGTKAPPSQETDSRGGMSTPTNRFMALDVQEQLPESKRMQTHSSSARREHSSGRSSQGSLRPGGGFNQMGKSSSQVSSRGDRESALAAAQALTAPAQVSSLSELKGELQDRSKESKNAPSTKSPEHKFTGGLLTEEQMEKKLKPTLDEFIHTGDFDEALRCVLELTNPNTIHLFVLTSFNLVLERSSQSHNILGQLMQKLINLRLMSLAQFTKGLQSMLDSSDDLAIDVPQIWKNLGQIITPIVLDGNISMSFLKEALHPFVSRRIASKLMPELLHTMAGVSGPRKVYELWNNSGLRWLNFLDTSENENEFISKHKLEFTLHEVKPTPSTKVSMEEAQGKLTNLFRTKANNEDVFDWIDQNIGPDQIKSSQFIRALVTAFTESAISLKEDGTCFIDNKTFKDRIVFIQKYLDHNESLELQALYALQALVTKYEHPKGMLHTIFEALYDTDSISEDAFNQWEKSTDPAEQGGKGVALKSIISFFTWLKEAEEESLEEN